MYFVKFVINKVANGYYWTENELRLIEPKKIAALLYDNVIFYVTDDIGNNFLKVQSSSGNTKVKDEKTKVQ